MTPKVPQTKIVFEELSDVDKRAYINCVYVLVCYMIETLDVKDVVLPPNDAIDSTILAGLSK